jgi:hypothetical protein
MAKNETHLNFLLNLIQDFSRGKSRPKICAASVILKELPKVNNGPTGENSPYLVALS